SLRHYQRGIPAPRRIRWMPRRERARLEAASDRVRLEGVPGAGSMRRAGVSLFAVLALSALPHRSAALPGDGLDLSAAPPGPIVDAPDGRSDMELVRFDDRVLASLRALAPEESIRVDDWPVAPGVRRQVALHRFDVYAP